MKVYYLSDLHLPFYVKLKKDKVEKYIEEKYIAKDSKDSIIVIAGDVSEYISQIKTTLETLSYHYEAVFFVFGNHDLYLPTSNQIKKHKGSSSNKIKQIEDYFNDKSNVYILNNKVVIYKDRKIAGTRLWYKIAETEEFSYQQDSNDYNEIYEKETNKPWIKYYNEDKAFYDSLDEVDLLVTHIPPIHPKASSYAYSPAFSAVVSELKSTKWICGHQHINTKEVLFDTTFYMNPVGYPNEKCSNSFNLKYFII